jgi:hypothetical protein
MSWAAHPLIGHDLSKVRVHADQDAEEATRAANAAAITAGNDVLIAPWAYRPDTDWGMRVMAHELVHVAQAGAAEHPATQLFTDRGDTQEREAESVSSAVLAGETVSASAAPVAAYAAFDLADFWAMFSGDSDETKKQPTPQAPDDKAVLELQRKMRDQKLIMETMTNIQNQRHETSKQIARGIRG